jgi:hypothetical protein
MTGGDSDIVMKFTSLRRTGLPIAEENDTAVRLFPQIVRNSRLTLWKPGDAVVAGRRLLVGVANWSLYDLSLLDVISDAIREGHSPLDRARRQIRPDRTLPPRA